MKYGELARKLRRLGCYPTRFGAGSHEIWRNPETHRQAPIPYHRTKDIGPGLLSRILRELGIEREDFNQV
ncbi:MAG TPA: type II toxin-antitoxin system HicA family toxin [Anaerolineae bacterium]